MSKIIDEYGPFVDIPESLEDRIELLKASMTEKSFLKFEEAKSLFSPKWETIKFVFYLVPKATPRPRLGQRGVFYVKGARDNKEFFKEYIKDKDLDVIMTATKFDCKTYFPTPSSMKKYERLLAEIGIIRPLSKPDWDNVGKSYCDMIQGLLLYDDSLVIEGTSSKFYSIKPRVEITLSWMVGYDSDFNRKKFDRGDNE